MSSHFIFISFEALRMFPWRTWQFVVKVSKMYCFEAEVEGTGSLIIYYGSTSAKKLRIRNTVYVCILMLLINNFKKWYYIEYFLRCKPVTKAQSSHREAIGYFWRIFHHGGKISPDWWGGGVNANPLTLLLPSRTKLQCTLQLRGQIHSTYFISTLKCTLWTKQSHKS
jgi:hypothetical protein